MTAMFKNPFARAAAWPTEPQPIAKVGDFGNNLLVGDGTDTLYGLLGDDEYVVNFGDIVVEDAGQGYDIVYALGSFSLVGGSHVELITAYNRASTATVTLIGNELGQTIVGNAGANLIVGGGGADLLYGLGGNDEYVVTDASAVVLEDANQGYDIVYALGSFTLTGGSHVEMITAYNRAVTTATTLIGNELGQMIVGNAGANLIVGGGGADLLCGIGGDDEYVAAADGLTQVVEDAGQGFDIVYALGSFTLTGGSHVELITAYNRASTAATTLIGNELSQMIVGSAGANLIVGGGGSDLLFGLGGNDEYLVADAATQVVEDAGEGYDVVYAMGSFTLTAGSHVELITAFNRNSTAAVNLFGNALAQTIVGNAGANLIVGGGGADALYGLGGDDEYLVADEAAQVIEEAGGGNDIVYAQGSFTLTAGSHVELITAFDRTSTGAVSLTGNALAQTIIGNAGNNLINGGGGADALYGLGGADTFLFTAALGAGNVATLADFQVGIDKIMLAGGSTATFSGLAAGAQMAGIFRVGTAAVDADDRIIYNSATGALLYDADGVGGAAAVQFAIIGTGLSLTAADFVVTGQFNGIATITSGTTASIAENSAASTIVYQTVATDPDGDDLFYSLSGTDAAFFTIDRTGAVRLINPADFETRSSYSFIVNVFDSGGVANTRNVTLTVTDVNETPPGGAYVVTETAEDNNQVGGAQVLDRSQFAVFADPNVPNATLPSARIQGSISVNSDRDYFSITLQAGEELILDVDGTTPGLDTLLRIFGPGGFTLSNDDAVSLDPGSSNHPTYGHNTDSFIRFRAPTTGTYTFSIESFDGGSSGSYTIHVSVGPVATPEQINDENINALIAGPRWNGTAVTYGFITDPVQYGLASDDARLVGFQPLSEQQRGVVRDTFSRISGFSALTFTELGSNPGGAQMRFGLSNDPDTAYAFYPGGGLGGDSFYNNEGSTYTNPIVGNYAYLTFVHEIGHALGLKHGHETPALSYDRDSMEFSVMTYRGYVGASTSTGYTNESFGFAQTFMMYDIAALQRIYGANFNTNAGDNVYTWSSTSGQFSIDGVGQWTPGANRVFMTIWDGGGSDTYNLSNYSTAVTIDLRPGEWTTTSQVQLANLGGGNRARGNVANSLLFQGDVRSLIENAVGGSGNDVLIANQAVNRLTGGAGNDTFRYHSTAHSGLNALADIITDFTSGSDRIDLSAIDANAAVAGDQAFSFIGTNAFTNVAGQLRYQVEGNSVRISVDVDGNGVADMQIVAQGTTTLTAADFIL